MKLEWGAAHFVQGLIPDGSTKNTDLTLSIFLLRHLIIDRHDLCLLLFKLLPGRIFLIRQIHLIDQNPNASIARIVP
jgi:hypothetical protein